MRIGSRRPKTTFRFGFDGRLETGQVESEDATVDDILESLGRHAQLSNQLDPPPLQYDDEPVELSNGPTFLSDKVTYPRVSGSLGRYGFILMLVMGFIILTMYAMLKAFADASYPSPMSIGSLLESILDDPIKIGLLGIIALLPVIAMRRRRARVQKLVWS